jgi:hypothetical protein
VEAKREVVVAPFAAKPIFTECEEGAEEGFQDGRRVALYHPESRVPRGRENVQTPQNLSRKVGALAAGEASVLQAVKGKQDEE